MTKIRRLQDIINDPKIERLLREKENHRRLYEAQLLRERVLWEKRQVAPNP